MPDATVDTSTYPRSQPFNLLGMAAEAQGIKNAQLQNQRQQVALSQDQVNYAHQQYDGLGQLITSLAANPAVGTAQGPGLVQQYADNAVKMGFITPQQRDAALQTMPQDPAQIPQWLQTQSLAHLDSQNRFSQTYGTPGTIDNGNTIQPVTSSPITGIRPIAAPIPKMTSPSERNNLVLGKNAQGQDVMTPQGQVVQKGGMNMLTGMPTAPPSQFSGQQNQLGQVPAPSSVQPQAGGGAAISPPAGQVESLQHIATASTDKYNADQQREANFQQDMLPLNKAYQGMKAAGDTGTGPGTETLNQVKSFLVSQGVIGPNDDVKNFDEVRKYTTQLARTNGDTGSDSRLAASFAGNPSVNISNAAAQDVLKSAISLRKLQNAQVQAFSQTGLPASQYQNWAQQWNKSQDPAAYGFDMMQPDARLKYIKSLSPEKKAAFASSLSSAVNLGLVERPSAAAPTQGN